MGIQAARKIISCVAAEAAAKSATGNQKQANYDQRTKEREREREREREKARKLGETERGEQKLKLQ